MVLYTCVLVFHNFLNCPLCVIIHLGTQADKMCNSEVSVAPNEESDISVSYECAVSTVTGFEGNINISMCTTSTATKHNKLLLNSSVNATCFGLTCHHQAI
jgi:hypothetical protein